MEKIDQILESLYSRVIEPDEAKEQLLLLFGVSKSLPIIEALNDYISLLGEELDETAQIAAVHGWQSKRIEQGEKLRAKLKNLGNVC